MRVNIRCLVTTGNSLVLCNLIKKGFYFLPGGGLEDGETINDAIYREFSEEMGLSKDVIRIEPEISVFEHIFEDDGKKHHEINLVKRVHILTEYIKSTEDHIRFEKVKMSDLKSKNILPTPIRNWMLDLFSC
jgi:ADP-ribose pyrophosphatase YjhB (NUDIX family)